MIRVMRIIEYTYADAETMAKDMMNWTLQGPTHHSHNKMSFKSTTLTPDFIEDTQPTESEELEKHT